MLSCLFCKRKKMLFKIFDIYGTSDCSTRDIILQFFGPVVSPEKYLHEEQGICKTCLFVLNYLLYIRSFMYEALITQRENCLEVSFAWTFRSFRRILKILDYDEPGRASPDLFTMTNNIAYMPPVDTDSKSADDDYGSENYYSLPREGTPYADREVQQAFANRKRKRTRKRMVKSALSKAAASPASFISEPVQSRRRQSRSSADLSDMSEDDRVASKLRFDSEGRLLNKETRSTTNILKKMGAALAECVYKCIDGCRREFADLSLLTQHKIEEHRMLAKYWCYECYKTRFTSQEDLEKHNEMVHKILITNCLLCSEELQNQEELQKHLEEHKLHSVPCNYCDKYFLNGRSCESHIQECHKGRKKRIKRVRPQTILDRIDKEVANENNIIQTPQSPVPDKFYCVKILIQSRSSEGEIIVDENNCVTGVATAVASCKSATISPDEDSVTSEDGEPEEEEVEEICVTAFEETFDVEEIYFSETEAGRVNVAEETACSIVEHDENVNLNTPDEVVEKLPDSKITELDVETAEKLPDIETTEITVETVAHDVVERYEDVQLRDDYSEHYADHIAEVCHEEVIIDNTDYQEVVSVVGGDEVRVEESVVQKETSPSPIEESCKDVDNLRALKTNPPKKQDIQSSNQPSRSFLGDIFPRPQLRVVLERGRIGSEFFKSIPVRPEPVVRSSVPSTSYVKKQEIAKPTKKRKKRTRVLTNVKTSGGLAEKKYTVTNKEQPFKKSVTSMDKALREKLSVFDFKEDSAANKMKMIKLPEASTKLKARGNVKLRSKNLRSYAPHKAKSKLSSSTDSESEIPTASMSVKIGKLQRTLGLPVPTPEREAELIAKYTNPARKVTSNLSVQTKTRTKLNYIDEPDEGGKSKNKYDRSPTNALIKF